VKHIEGKGCPITFLNRKRRDEDYSSHPFAKEGGGWSAILSVCFTHGKGRYFLYKSLGGREAGPDGTENLGPTGVRSLDRPVRSRSLYRSSCTRSKPILYLSNYCETLES
jgi:hypothetical protein